MTNATKRFTEKFKEYACIGDSIDCEFDGFDVKGIIKYDDYHDIDDDDCHNLDQSVTGASDETQEKIVSARKAYFDGEWFYCGVCIEVRKDDIFLSDSVSLWGIECNYPGSDNSYLTEVAEELLENAIDEAKEAIERLKD